MEPNKETLFAQFGVVTIEKGVKLYRSPGEWQGGDPVKALQSGVCFALRASTWRNCTHVYRSTQRMELLCGFTVANPLIGLWMPCSLADSVRRVNAILLEQGSFEDEKLRRYRAGQVQYVNFMRDVCQALERAGIMGWVGVVEGKTNVGEVVFTGLPPVASAIEFVAEMSKEEVRKVEEEESASYWGPNASMINISLGSQHMRVLDEWLEGDLADATEQLAELYQFINSDEHDDDGGYFRQRRELWHPFVEYLRSQLHARADIS